ncbi:phosphoglycerate dehydrogenase [Desulfobacula toluolica]|uniref:Predicted D-3-phosphoglycerate dehydrogenase n=1 Tax=Desulfobacula toluolica (strain DSM 7467 / Tol2) TaxID=651182 RepID=K0NK74_DESTT|nr:phosphoglycerate dehydrogenase [Desulfobacula toluolica]CCK80313.1 predicted D-3-phosphoglycerate dehydrogenase [Desulfobacula toluolica Tol2]
MAKIFISTVPFCEINKKPLMLLKKNGFEIIKNPLGRKLHPKEVAEYAKSVDGIIAGTESLIGLIEANSNLKIISRVGIGLDSVPLIKCKQLGITVTYTPDAVTMAVAEMVIGVMISVYRHIYIADREIRNQQWNRLMGKRIGKSIIGLIGFGRIGYNVARLLTPFHPNKVLINDITDKKDSICDLMEQGLNIEQVSKEEIYKNSDIISLHVPFSPQTNNLINRNTLSKFKKDSFILNYARGGIINEHDLYLAIEKGSIAGAAVDTFIDEPYSGELIELDNVLLTQHMGSCSYDCRYDMELQATEDLIRFFKGEQLQNEVPPEEYEYQQ